MSILEKIMAERKEQVEARKAQVSVGELEAAAASRQHHSLTNMLIRPGTHIIAEAKKASPSAGLLRPDYDPAAIAQSYEKSGATGISVLTEPRHFLGSEDHLRAVRAAVSIPVLRKDFMCDEYQVYEAAAWGADVILLIAAALDAAQMKDLYDCATGLGLDVLAESHNAEELELSMALPHALLGINSRNLKTLKTDLETARSLAGTIPEERISIAESGIKTREDIAGLLELGYNGFLIGESLLGDGEPGERLAALLGEGLL